jgi:XTP/dITP diphosphohydrolase
MIDKLLIATTNSGKRKELSALLQPLQLQIVTPLDVNIHLEVEESGSTYAENAELKARAFCQASHLPTLADDTGLEVEALGGAPGLHSARFSNQPHATDADRRALLLARLQGFPRSWLARFVCWVALALPDGDIHFSDGACYGKIIPEERGSEGFGYDPLFLFPDQGKTMAELSLAEKNLISHRARAVQGIIPIIQSL